jgi:hypothetical protein
MRIVYASKPGGKPLNIGMNVAKRRAHRLDKQDRARIIQVLGAGMPDDSRTHHQALVKSRHRYYHEQHDEFVRARSQSDGSGDANG